MKEQTAVEWLEQQLFNKRGKFTKGDIEQAKAMEKEQIIESYCQACLDIFKNENIFPIETGEQYYKKKYESNTRI